MGSLPPGTCSPRRTSDRIGFYGNFFACASRLDYPGIDCLVGPATVPWHVAKLLGSIACLPIAEAMSETSDHAQRYRPPETRGLLET